MPDTYSQKHIKSTITAGSVYYYCDKSISPKQHYFVVININPVNDTVIILLCASSQIISKRRFRSNCPQETLIEISPTQYIGFTKKSIIDCNDPFLRSIDEIAHMLSKNKLQIKPVMGLRLVEKLREGVILSSLVAEETKKLLQAD